MHRGTQVDEGYGFEAVEAALADPFPPGPLPARVRMPSVPKVRSAEDDEAHLRAYWRSHVWAVLHRYRAAFEDPACPPSLAADYPRVTSKALHLVERATASHPITPIDSVACHAALKDLTSGAAVLERTVAALRGAPEVLPADPPAAQLGRAVQAPGSAAAHAVADADTDTDELPAQRAPAGVHGQDFFPPGAPSKGFEFKLSLRGSRGLRRSRSLGGDPTPPSEPVTPSPALD